MASEKQGQMPNEAVIYMYIPTKDHTCIWCILSIWNNYFSSPYRTAPKSSAFACEVGIPFPFSEEEYNNDLAGCLCSLLPLW